MLTYQSFVDAEYQNDELSMTVANAKRPYNEVGYFVFPVATLILLGGIIYFCVSGCYFEDVSSFIFTACYVSLLGWAIVWSLWAVFGLRRIQLSDQTILIESRCLFWRRIREFVKSDLLRIDWNIEPKEGIISKQPILTLDLMFESKSPKEPGFVKFSLPCLTESQFDELTDIVTPFLPEQGNGQRGFLVQMEKTDDSVRLVLSNIRSNILEMGLLPLFLAVAFILLFFYERTFLQLSGALLGFCIGMLIVWFTRFFIFFFFNRQALTIEKTQLIVESRFFGWKKKKRYKISDFDGVRCSYLQRQLNRPASWTVEIKAGRRTIFPVTIETASREEQRIIAETINTFLGWSETELQKPIYDRFVRDGNEIRMPLSLTGEAVVVSFIGSLFCLVLTLGFCALVISEQIHFSGDFLLPLTGGLLTLFFIVNTFYSGFGKRVIQCYENRIVVSELYPFYPLTQVEFERSRIQDVRIAEPFSVPELPDFLRVRKAPLYVQLMINNGHSLALPCRTFEDQIWLIHSIKELIPLNGTTSSPGRFC